LSLSLAHPPKTFYKKRLTKSNPKTLNQYFLLKSFQKSPTTTFIRINHLSLLLMATGKSCYGRSNYRFLTGDISGHHHHHSFTSDFSFELNESDIYNSGTARSPTRIPKKKISSKRVEVQGGGGASSLPVNIPDWSKILKEEYREKRSSEYADDMEDDEDEEEEMRVPPHEFLARQMARTRIASFSVHEGIGRTLKGRDLSRVRNAIWEKTGFED
uniref:Senescence regulator n=3 Tax=Cucumis melo TaxID=3656 RepID=A0A9I9DYC3_CUCME